jgi:DNA-binding NarL/FixJ family response regulator
MESGAKEAAEAGVKWTIDVDATTELQPRLRKLLCAAATAASGEDHERTSELLLAAVGLCFLTDFLPQSLRATGNEAELRTALLSSRELEIAKLAVNGLSNKEIARKLSLAVSTIEQHLHSVYRKLEIRGRTELRVALRHLEN